MDIDDFIISGSNAFHIETKEAGILKVGHPDVKVLVKVVFHSEVIHYALDHSPSVVNICYGLNFAGREEKITISNFDEYTEWSTLKENFSKSIPAANPKVRPGTKMFDKILYDVFTEVHRNCLSKVDYIGCSSTLLILEVRIVELVFDCCECEECRAIRESVESLIVPASESSIKKLLKRVRVAAAADLEEDPRRKRRRRNDSGSKRGKNLGARPSDSDECTICSDEFTAGEYAAQMPCLHSFHRQCIKHWLRQSHYCPICRYEMPVANDKEE